MKKLYITIICLLPTIAFSQQEEATLWQRNFSSGGQDILSDVSLTPDRQYLIAGSSINNNTAHIGGSANSGYDYHLVKLDQQGNPVWEKYYGGSGHDYLSSAVATQEGGFLLCGTSYSGKSSSRKKSSKGSCDLWLIKTDENGEEQWQQVIGTRYRDQASGAVQSTDLGYYVAGSVLHPKLGLGSQDVYLTKLDQDGNIERQLILGGVGSDEVESILATADGGCLLGIYSTSGKYEGLVPEKVRYMEFTTGISSDRGEEKAEDTKEPEEIHYYAKQSDHYGIGDYWIVKIDKSGNVEWEKDFGGSGDDHIRTLTRTSYGYVVGGESRSETSGNKRTGLKEGTDLWLLALDENGEEMWQKSYDYSTRDILMSLKNIETKDGETKGLLIGGYSQAEGAKKKEDYAFWMVYTDKEGQEQWRKIVEGTSRKAEERLVSAEMTVDGQYILAGTSAEESGKELWKVVKLGDKDVEGLIENKEIRIYPNPVEDYCYVELGFELEQGEDVLLEVYDFSGRKVSSKQSKARITKLSTGILPQGVYIVNAKMKSKSVNAKIVKK